MTGSRVGAQGEACSRSLHLFDDEWRQLLQDAAADLWQATTRVEDDLDASGPPRDDEQRALDPLRDRGFTLVGYGLGRLVVRFPEESDHGHLVAKLARYGDKLLSMGIYQNRVEVETWLTHGGPESPLLPAYEWSDSQHRCGWVIFPYAPPVVDHNINPDEAAAAKEDVDRRVTAMDIPLHAAEVSEQNVALYDGEPRLADYGRRQPVEGWWQ